MKNYLLILSLVSVLFSCNKPDDGDEPVEETSFRVTKATFYDRGVESEMSEYIYTDNKLTKWKMYLNGGNDEWVLFAIADFKYSTPYVIMNARSQIGGKSHFIIKFEYKIINGKMVEFLEYRSDSLVPNNRYSYTYNGNNLVSYLREMYEDGHARETEKREYIWENSKLKTCKIYYEPSDWYVHFTENYFYKDNTFEMITYRIVDSLIFSKEVNTLSNGRVAIREYYSPFNTGNLDYKGKKEFFFSTDSYLIEEHSDVRNDDEMYKYVYEKGRGNISWFTLPDEHVQQTPMPQKFRVGERFFRYSSQ